MKKLCSYDFYCSRSWVLIRCRREWTVICPSASRWSSMLSCMRQSCWKTDSMDISSAALVWYIFEGILSLHVWGRRILKLLVVLRLVEARRALVPMISKLLTLVNSSRAMLGIPPALDVVLRQMLLLWSIMGEKAKRLYWGKITQTIAMGNNNSLELHSISGQQSNIH